MVGALVVERVASTTGGDFGWSLARERVFSRSESREDMSAIMAFLVLRMRGPCGGKTQCLRARVQAEHGSFLSHRIFFRLQL